MTVESLLRNHAGDLVTNHNGDQVYALVEGQTMHHLRRPRVAVAPAPPPPHLLSGRVVRSLPKWPQWLEYATAFTDRYRVEDTTQNLYELYVGEDGSDPDFTAAPAATSATLPFDYALTPPLAGTKEYRIARRYRNEFGVVNLNQYSESFTIDDAGALVVPDPTSPQDTALSDGNGYRVVLTAKYYPDDDGDNRADTWDIYYTDDGTDPDPALDTPVEVTMGQVASEETLVRYLGPFSAGDDVRVILRVRRSSDDEDDGNSTVVQHDVVAQPTAPGDGFTFGGSAHEYML
jgi:hypothetical protein